MAEPFYISIQQARNALKPQEMTNSFFERTWYLKCSLQVIKFLCQISNGKIVSLHRGRLTGCLNLQ
jgi:hypothetical protein